MARMTVRSWPPSVTPFGLPVNSSGTSARDLLVRVDREQVDVA